MGRVQLLLPKDFDFITEIKIRVSDLNYGNHLANDAILTIAHEARVRFLDHHGLKELNEDLSGLIMTDSMVLYKAEGFWGQMLKISLAITNYSKCSFDLLYMIEDKESQKEIARLKTGMAFFDYTKRRIQGLPEVFKNLAVTMQNTS